LPVEIRILEPREAGAWRRHRAELEASRIDERLQRLGNGHSCVAAWLDGEIVASVWLALDEARIPEIDRNLRLGRGEVFAYDSYTSEGARGHGIATMRAVWTARYLRDAGYDVVLGHVTPENRPGHGPPARAGYQELGTAGYVRLGPWRRDYVRPVGLERRWSRSQPIVVATDFGLVPAEPAVTR
jgi:GNAT superfamily N-acetyltransferase